MIRTLRGGYTALFFLLILIMLSVIVTASYTQNGGTNSLYERSDTAFNLAMDEDVQTPYTASLTDWQLLPIIDDLDGDGTDEFLVYDGEYLRVYNQDMLNLFSVDLGESTTRSSNMITFDIDGTDNYTEIIIAHRVQSTNLDLFIYEFNGTELVQQTKHDIFTGATYSGQIGLNCRDVEECMYITTDGTGLRFDAEIDAFFFNTTDVGASTQVAHVVDPNPDSAFCLPYDMIPVVTEIGDGGNKEFIYTYGLRDDGGDEITYVQELDMATAYPYTITATKTTEIDSSSLTNDGTDCIVSGFVGKLTNPIVREMESGFSGKEIVVGHNAGANNFRLSMYSRSGQEIQRCPNGLPLLDYYYGVSISNLASGQIVPTGRDSACAIGYNDEIGDTLACITSADCIDITLETQSEYNISTVKSRKNMYDRMIHAIDADDNLEPDILGTSGGIDNLEIMSPYGMFEIDGDCNSLWGTWRCDAVQIYRQPTAGNQSIVFSDIEGDGKEEMFILSDLDGSHTFTYLDDNYLNTGGQILAVETSPCWTDPWKTNGTIEVSVQVADLDGDLLNAIVILYYGLAKEYNTSWSANFSNGSVINFEISPNSTQLNTIMRVCARDTYNTSVLDCENFAINVKTTGYETGYSTCSEQYDLIDSGGNILDEGQLIEKDSVTSAVEALNETFGWNFSTAVIWMILMALVAYLTAVNVGGSAVVQVSAIIVMQVIMLVIGVTLHFIGFGYLVMLLLVFVAITALIIRNQVVGGG